eukprot:s1075_g18.t1
MGWEEVQYLCPSSEDHGHWVKKADEAPRVTRCIMSTTTEPVDERSWIALEREWTDAWTLRKRLRGKTTVRKLDASMDPQEQKEEERQKEKWRIQKLIEEESRQILDDDPDLAAVEASLIAKLKKALEDPSAEEEVLQTKIISPKVVFRDWLEWLPAVNDEVRSLVEEKKALKELTPEEHEALVKQAAEDGRGIEYLPSKTVYTIKPTPLGSKRKVRWVVCGNFEERKEGEETYSSGADSVAFRVLIWLSAKLQWFGCSIDVKTAFLNADLQQPEEENLMLIKPPHIMIEKGYLRRNTVFQPLKAVYGFRRSPRLWGNCRDDAMRSFIIDVKDMTQKFRLVQLNSEPNLWRIVPLEGNDDDKWVQNGGVCGLVMTYVDDLFIVAPWDLMEAVRMKFQATWTTSEAEYVGEKAVRFLGMEVRKRKNETGRDVWYISQEGYVRDLLSRQSEEEKQKKVPISRDQSLMELDEKTPTPEKVRQCQKEVGELLWLVTRTRPDLMYGVARMGSSVTRSTAKVLEAAAQMRGYLQGTWREALRYEDEEKAPVVIMTYSDASFSPEGEESHGSFIISINQSPIFWRSGRQSTITLSTAESELNEVIESMNGGESVAVIVAELCEEIEKRAHTDSQSAIAILSSEGGSWRTRHLRMRSAYARQVIKEGDWQLTHVPGEKLIADLGTKSLSSNRLQDLKRLLGMEEVEEKSAPLPKEEKSAPPPKEETSAPLPEESRKSGGTVAAVGNPEVTTALKLITLAATIAMAKGGSENEDFEEKESQEFEVMMLVYTALVVVVTIFIQFVWKVGVGRNRGTPQIEVVPRPRSLPAQVGRKGVAAEGEESASESKKEDRAPQPTQGGGEIPSGSNDRVPTPAELDSGRGDPARLAGGLRGEDGLGRPAGHRSQLPRDGGRGEDSSSSLSSSDSNPLPVAGQDEILPNDMAQRVENALEEIAQEETQMWREIRGNLYPPNDPNEEANDPNSRLLVLKTACGTVYHFRRSCHHLAAPRVSAPRRYLWCGTCRRVLLATRGHPPPGIPLFLSEREGVYHTDPRCPRKDGCQRFRACITCLQDEGVA